MNYELRPPRRGLLPNLPADIANHIARIEYTVFTKADCPFAWKLFTDIESWPSFCSLYENLRWQGKPWIPGSRLRIDVGDPVNATADRVVTVCMPPQHIAWINHVCGYTMEQWISLDPYLRGTRITTWIEVTGGDPSRNRVEDIHLLQRVVQEWFDNFSRACDLIASDPEPGDIRSAAD